MSPYSAVGKTVQMYVNRGLAVVHSVEVVNLVNSAADTLAKKDTLSKKSDQILKLAASLAS